MRSVRWWNRGCFQQLTTSSIFHRVCWKSSRPVGRGQPSRKGLGSTTFQGRTVKKQIEQVEWPELDRQINEELMQYIKWTCYHLQQQAERGAVAHVFKAFSSDDGFCPPRYRGSDRCREQRPIDDEYIDFSLKEGALHRSSRWLSLPSARKLLWRNHH